jgi:serine/threonine kinase 38
MGVSSKDPTKASP